MKKPDEITGYGEQFTNELAGYRKKITNKLTGKSRNYERV